MAFNPFKTNIDCSQILYSHNIPNREVAAVLHTSKGVRVEQVYEIREDDAEKLREELKGSSTGSINPGERCLSILVL